MPLVLHSLLTFQLRTTQEPAVSDSVLLCRFFGISKSTFIICSVHQSSCL